MPDGPELRKYIAAEEVAIEQLLRLADRHMAVDPPRAMHCRITAKRRAHDLLMLLEWLGLRGD